MVTLSQHIHPSEFTYFAELWAHIDNFMNNIEFYDIDTINNFANFYGINDESIQDDITLYTRLSELYLNLYTV